MFDSTPLKFSRPPAYNELQHELALARANATQTKRGNRLVLDLIAKWEREPTQLRQAIDIETDWGPFELAEMSPVYHDVYGAPRILCRFVFHGEPKERAHFEKILHERLSHIASWKIAPWVQPTDAD